MNKYKPILEEMTDKDFQNHLDTKPHSQENHLEKYFINKQNKSDKKPNQKLNEIDKGDWWATVHGVAKGLDMT